MSELAFHSKEFQYSTRDSVDAHFLREDHWTRLSRSATPNGSNVLRDATIGMANLYSAISAKKILDIYCDRDEVAKRKPINQQLAERLSYKGVLVIPYYPNGMCRMRTDLDTKYLSPIGVKEAPPYVIPALTNPTIRDWMYSVLVKEIQSDLPETSPEDIKHTLDLNGWNTLHNGLSRKETPALVVEGEFKALSIYDALLDAMRERTVAMLSGVPLDQCPPMPPAIVPIGIGGVYNMIHSDENLSGISKAYRLRPEWKPIFPRDEVLICFDSDARIKTGVAHAASSTAGVLEKGGSTVRYIQIPAEADEKMGADDFIAAHGYRAFLQAVRQAKPIRGGLSWKAITECMKVNGDAFALLYDTKKVLKQDDLEFSV